MENEILLQKDSNVNFLQNFASLLKCTIDYLLQENNNQIRTIMNEYLSNEVQDNYLKINQVCDFLNIKRQTLDNWKKNGVLIPDSYIGRSPVYLESKIIKLKKH